ncbi:MAG: LPS export ABC transporter permease LptG [Gammaproteobacteria bacterium]|nr:LPS export ABC transporter permease LptG [Gammaproteobacteria bacterium]
MVAGGEAVILDLYLAGHVLRRMLMVFAALLALFALVTFIGELGAAAADYDFTVMARFALLSLPGFATALFPMALLLGAVLGLGQLAATSELSAMRAAGRSLPRITFTVLLAGAPLAAAAVMVGEVVAPQTERLAERVRAAALHREVRGSGEKIWLRDGNQFVHIGEVLPDNSLREIKVFTITGAGGARALSHVVHAARAVHHAGGWQLQDATRTVVTSAPQTTRHAMLPWAFSPPPGVFTAWQTRPAQLPLLDLHRHIRHLRDNGQRTAAFELAWWNKLLLPATAAVMLFLAIPCVFTHPRSAAVERGMLSGTLAALAFYIAGRGFGYAVLLYSLPPAIGALAPAAVFLGAALWWMRRVSA